MPFLAHKRMLFVRIKSTVGRSDGLALFFRLKVFNYYFLIKISYDYAIKLFCMFFLTFVVKSKIIGLFYILSQ